MNRILPTADRSVFELIYVPPPPPPIKIRFTFNHKEVFSQTDVENILNAFYHLIHRNEVFMERFKGVKELLIAVVKNFHCEGNGNEKETDHINCYFSADGKKDGVVHHVYFTRNRRLITQFSQLNYEKLEF